MLTCLFISVVVSGRRFPPCRSKFKEEDSFDISFIVGNKMANNEERDPLEEPISTQMLNPSIRKYVAVFLFHYDVNDDKPFSSVSLNNFKDTDFPFDVINGHMGLSDRLKPRHLSRLPGSKYCIFAKCEEGEMLICF